MGETYEMMKVVLCAALLCVALAVATEEGSAKEEEQKLVGSCTDSLTTLLDRKAKTLRELSGMADHLKQGGGDAPKSKEAKDKDGKEEKSNVGEAAAIMNAANAIAADAKAAVKKFGGDAAPQAAHESEVVELGENDEPEAPQEAAEEKVDSKPEPSKLPPAVAKPSTTDTTKELVQACLMNIVKVATRASAVADYAKCLKDAGASASGIGRTLARADPSNPRASTPPEAQKIGGKEEAKEEDNEDGKPKPAADPKAPQEGGAKPAQ